MSEFAQIGESNVVLQVILADQEFIDAGLAGSPSSWIVVEPPGSAGIGYSWHQGTGVFSPPLSSGPSLEAAKAELMAMIEAATAPILDAYPRAERLSWDAKEAEAAGFMNAELPVVSDYPLLRGECAAEETIAAGDVTLPMLADKAEAVLWMASQWRDLISFLSGLRKRTEAAIDLAEEDAGRRAAVEAARAAIEGVAF